MGRLSSLDIDSLDRRPAQSGLVSVELALLLPLLFLLTFGLLEYGWMFLKAQEITNAARQGARIGAVPDATNVDVQTTITNLMNAAGMGTSGYSVTIAPGSVDILSPGDTLTVTLSVPYSNVGLIGISLIPVPGTLTGSTSMAKEGP